METLAHSHPRQGQSPPRQDVSHQLPCPLLPAAPSAHHSQRRPGDGPEAGRHPGVRQTREPAQPEGQCLCLLCQSRQVTCQRPSATSNPHPASASLGFSNCKSPINKEIDISYKRAWLCHWGCGAPWTRGAGTGQALLSAGKSTFPDL